ncbi:hypothetical protein HDU80_000724 [Chytriomyces hyalinus]|nr:hypothetical protein HDU80_000724 [Chytriomyces hyalinus]
MGVVVTFADSATVWFEIEPQVTARVPLKGVTWLQNGRQQRLIESLEMRFVPFRADLFPPLLPGTPTPFAVHLFLVNEEDSERYKSAVKKQIADWLAIVGPKKSQECLIVYFSNPNKKDARGFLNSSVADRIKADYGQKTNVLILKPVHPKDPTIWNDFFAKLRELILSSFNAKLAVYEEDIRRLDSQRLLPGWNYCQFFIMKDGSACTYEYLNVIDDALLQYDELEAAFFQNLLEQGAPWFQSFGGNEPGDDSHSILNVNRKPYRDRILQNTISIFDFRIYLFARQISLLFQIAHGVVETCIRAKKFISSFARTLREYSAGLVPHFTESWVYTSCMCVIAQCDERAAAMESTDLTVYAGLRAELLQYARLQLDILGACAGLFTSSIHKMPDDELSTVTASGDSYDANAAIATPSESVTNPDLKKALETEADFDALYLSLSERAIKDFETSQRKRTALILKGDIASLHFHRKRFKEAAAICASVPTRSTLHEGWEKMDQIMLQQLIQCLNAIEQPEKPSPMLVDASLKLLGDAWVRLSAEDLGGYVDIVNRASAVIVDNGAVAKAAENSKGPNSEFVNLSCFHVSISRFINRVGNEEPHELELRIENRLPKMMDVPSIKATMISKDSTVLVCGAELVKLEPGENIVRLKCAIVTTPGTYSVEKIILTISGVPITYPVPFNRVRKTSFEVKRQLEAFEFSARFLPSFDDSSKKITRRVLLIRIGSKITFPSSDAPATLGIIPISLATVPPMQTVKFKTTREDGGPVRDDDMPVTNRLIQIPEFRAGDTVSCLVPITVDKNHVSGIDMKFVIQYVGSDGKERAFSKIDCLRLLPPLKCTHKMVPHGLGTLIQFKLEGNSDVPLRLDGTSLSGISGYEVKSFCKSENMLIFKNHSVNLVFQLKPNGGDASQKAVLNVKYHPVSEEMSSHISEALRKFLEEKGKLKYSQFLSKYLTRVTQSMRDILTYSFTGRLDLPTESMDAFKNMLLMEEKSVADDLWDLFSSFVQRCPSISSSDVLAAKGLVDASSLPYGFDIERHQIVLSAGVLPVHTLPDYRVGSVISCVLTVNATFWSDDVASESLEVTYDISADNRRWIVSGLSRRRFSIKKGEVSEFRFDLMAISAGKLLLPLVKVASVQPSVSVYCSYPRSEEILVLPSETETVRVQWETMAV